MFQSHSTSSKAHGSGSQPQLGYKDQASLLDAIARLSVIGIEKDISLPRIVVVGDQSSGKSSTLEAISHIRFPKKDTLCTTFATEVAIRRSSGGGSPARIIPGPSRTDSERLRLNDFKCDEDPTKDMAALIETAKQAMGEGHQGSEDSYFEDKLRIELCKPDWPPLDIIDLPGLIQSPNPKQTEDDVKFVGQLVEGYMKEPRSIILAVVSAQNDAACQVVLSLVKQLDPYGIRTLYVITKPDMLPAGSGSEQNFVKLAQTHGGRLGCHVIRNSGYNERHQSHGDRDAAERSFFQKGTWPLALPSKSLGIDALRNRLSILLHEHIVTSLPGIVDEIRVRMDDSQAKLAKLGPSRLAKADKQAYLANIASEFRGIVQSADQGKCKLNFAFFGNPFSVEGQSRRLRAVVANLNWEFREVMDQKGHKWHITDSESPKQMRRTLSNSSEQSNPTSDDPASISRRAYLDRVRELSRVTRGTELPGSFADETIRDLFREQSEKWKGLALRHIDRIHKAVKVFLQQAFETLIEGRTLRAMMCELVDPHMDQCYRHSHSKLDDILAPYTQQYPMTYHPLLLVEVASRKHERQRKQVHKELDGCTTTENGELLTTTESMERLIKALEADSEDPMDMFACEKALDRMLAYYEISKNVFIDNLALLVIEPCLIDSIFKILPADFIQTLDDDRLERIAAESEETQIEREMLSKKLEELDNGLKICRKHSSYIQHGPEEINSQERQPVTPNSKSPALPDLVVDSGRGSSRRTSPFPRTPESRNGEGLRHRDRPRSSRGKTNVAAPQSQKLEAVNAEDLHHRRSISVDGKQKSANLVGTGGIFAEAYPNEASYTSGDEEL